MNDLIQIYKQVEKHCLCLDNSSIAIISQSLEIGLKDSISNDEELHVLLLSINTLHLVIKKLIEQSISNKDAYKEILNENTITKLINIMLNHSNKFVTYSIRKILIDILFSFHGEQSIFVKNFILQNFKKSVSLTNASYNLLEILRDFCQYKSNIHLDAEYQEDSKAASIYDRIEDIKLNIFHELMERWNDILCCFINKDSNEDIQNIILDLWYFVLMMTVKIHFTSEEFLTTKQSKELLNFSCICSSNTCFKFITVTNQIFSEYLKVSNFSSSGINSFSYVVIDEVINNWLFKIKLKTNYNFSGEDFVEKKHDQDQNIGIIYTCCVVLKALNIIIKSNETDFTEILQAHEMLNRWLSFQKGNRSNYPNQIWLIEIFLNQDDQLLEMMLCYLNLYIYIKNSQKISEAKRDKIQVINPHIIFLKFLNELRYDYSVLLDFLTSSETCLLLYLVKYLKLLRFEWSDFVEAHKITNHLTRKNVSDRSNEDGSLLDSISPKTDTAINYTNDLIQNKNIISIQNTIELLSKLKSKIQKLTDKNLFPYNAQPLLYHLDYCLKQYKDSCRK